MSNEIKQQAKEILAKLTLQDKIALQTGQDVWTTMPIPHADLPSIRMADGPHGLRKTVGDGDNLGIQGSYPAVCMPTASKLACSFDRELLQQVGVALAEQCNDQGVDILLGPGINIKRNSRCGRNFEYFAEDPYLTGELAVSYVNGVQSQGVGVSVKHFAGNSQEYARMTADSCIDQRALNEVYFNAFRKVVTLCQPYTVMCAYNKLNGQLCSQNEQLLTDTLRNKWGFDGLIVSDWGAVSDRVQSIKSGLDLQMPHCDSTDIQKAIKKGKLTEQQLDNCVLRIIELVLRCQSRTNKQCNYEQLHQLARRASAESTVLLKNNMDILPLKPTDDIAIIGAFARHPHFQGGGSSKVNAYKVRSLTDALDSLGISYEYADGYPINSAQPDQKLIDIATDIASRHDKVVLVVGLPDVCEYEGFDRPTMALPDSHMELIHAVTSANANVVAVLQCGAPVVTKWAQGVKALLVDYLAGEAQGEALADVLYGAVNPCGRLAETWAHDDDSQPFNSEYATQLHRVLYKESIFVGYQYYDTFKQSVAYPFGYGLSYTNFNIKSAKLDQTTVDKDGKLTVNITVENNGNYDGKAVVQLYVRALDAKRYRANKQLKGFEKVLVKAGKTARISVQLDIKELEYYNTTTQQITVDGGNYQLLVGYDVSNIVFTLPFAVNGEVTDSDQSEQLPFYYDYTQPLNVTDSQFATVYGQLPPDRLKKRTKHTIDSTFIDIQNRFWGRVLYKQLMKVMDKLYYNQPEMLFLARRTIESSPLRVITMQKGISLPMVKALVDIVNGKVIRGVAKLLSAYKKEQKRLKQQQDKKHINNTPNIN